MTARLSAVLVAVALTVAAGAAISVGGQSPSPPPGEIAVERYAETTGVEGVRTTTVKVDGRTTYEATHRFKMVPGTDHRWQRPVTEGTAPVTVTDGSVRWRRGGGDIVYRRRAPRDASATYRAFLDEAFDGVGRTSTVPAVPTVPAGDDRVSVDGVGRFDVSYGGTESVAGREAYVLHLEAVDRPVGATVWVDAERLYPLKVRQVGQFDGRRVVATVEHTEVRFGVSFSPDTFRVDPPADATVRRLSASPGDRIGGLLGAVNVSAVEPSVPVDDDVPVGGSAASVPGRVPVDRVAIRLRESKF